jgi:hypothetical protein
MHTTATADTAIVTRKSPMEVRLELQKTNNQSKVHAAKAK